MSEHVAAPPPNVPEDHGDRALVSVLICGPRTPEAVEAAVASVHAQSWPCEAVVAQHPDAGEALHQALATSTGQAFLILGADETLLPGAIRVLASCLMADPALAAVWGDTLVTDAATGAPLAWQTSLHLPGVAARAALELLPARPGACLVRRSAEGDELPPRAATIEPDELLAWWAAAGPTAAVPVPVCVFRAPAGSPAAAFRDGWRVPHEPGVHPGRFADRWRRADPDRDTAHAWARGLYARKLYQEAREEATRWPAPYSASEVRLRRQLGLPTPPGPQAEALIVVDDGDIGALEETLARYAGRHALWVDLEVHREPLAPIRQLWEGTYGARQRLHQWVKHPGPWHLRLTSDPDWAPPPLDHLGYLPDIPAPDAVIALAAVHDWPLPQRTRSGLVEPAHAQARALVQARLALRRGRPREAIPSLTRALRWMSGWVELWQVAEATFAAAGLTNYAAECRRQIASLSDAASMVGK